MRQFFKITIASFFGFIIGTAVLACVAFVVIVGILAAGSSDTLEVKDNSVLTVNLSGEIVEHTITNPLNSLMGNTTGQQGLDDIVGAIDKAASMKEISAIYVEAGLVKADYASMQEIRQALERAKAKKKLIVSYAKEYTQGAYYVCSVADQVWIHPEGMLDLHGLAAQPMYVKDLLEKFGVRMTVVKVGKYKSATEMYTEEKMSDANRQQVTRYISGIWDTVKNAVSTSRHITTAEVDSCADALTELQSSDYLAKHRLIDRRLYAEEVKTELKKMLHKTGDDEIEKVTCSALSHSSIAQKMSDNKIAVYYCEGSIVRAKEAGLIMGDAGIVSTDVVKDLEKLTKDDDVKAVVVRVNSGGGDAFASEEIWHAIKTLKTKKPVVVSMSGAAASGAYYMSCIASYIIAQPTTLTGSIGIFGTFPDVSSLMTEKLGIKYDMAKTNRHSDFSYLQQSRPFTPEEQALLQGYINRGYELFCKRVAEGRKMPVEKVKAIAQGHVWLGMDAVKIGLVDALGGIGTAIDKAAKLAKVKDYETVSYPEEPDMLEQLTGTLDDGGNGLDEQLRLTLGAYYEPFVMVRNLQHQSPVQARCLILPVRE